MYELIKKNIPWIIGLLYLISPIDIIPDFIPGLGRLDDIGIVGLTLWWFFKNLNKKKEYYNQSKNYSDHNNSSQNNEPEHDESDPYIILGIKSDASREEIKAAYKKLAAQYHPDKVQHLGKELRDLAQKKFVAIQNAYDRLK